ncbi:PAS domain S-box protein, partial [Lutibacter sp.]|uniref:PAS domain S-box protein n=1 Tax=Lutibacter sp. TaxID=1925666 RepID=UPI00356ADDD7
LVLVLFYAIDALFIINYNFENQLLIKIGNLISTEVILISPITVMVFGLSTLNFILINFKKNKFTTYFIYLFFYVQFVIAAVFIFGYVENIPSIFHNDIFPSLLSVISFLIICFIQLHQLKFKIWPFHIITKSTIQSRLLKAFLPIAILYILLKSIFQAHLVDLSNILQIILLFVLISTIIISYSFISKKIDNDLSESKSLYQSLFNNSIIGLYQTTPKGKVLSANPTLIKMLEYDSLDDLMEQDLSNGTYVDPNKRKEFIQLLERYGEISKFEAKWYTKNGKIITVEESCKAIKNQNGKIIRFDGVVENVSEYKVTLNKLKISEERLNLVLDSNKIGIWTLNLIDNTNFRTIQHDNIFGYKTLLPKWDYETFLSHVYHADKEVVYQKYIKCIENGIPWDCECRIHRADGALRWIRISGNHQTDASGKSIAISGMIKDVTKSKLEELEILEAKNELDDIFKNDISANFTVSINGKILNCNRTFLKLFKVKNLEEAKSKKIIDYYCNPQIKTHLLKLILQNKKALNEEVDFITSTGEKINCLVNLVGIFNNENKLIKTRGYLVNITKLKNYQHSLKQSEKRFKLAAKATNEVIWERDLINETFWRSKNFETIFGWNPNDFGNTDDDIKKRVHPEDLERVSEKIYQFFESDANLWEDTYRLLKADGTYAWVYDRAFKFNDKSGKPLKVVGSMANITNRKLQEQKLKESEENYRTIVDNAIIGVYETDLKGTILFSNQYIKEQSGFTGINELENTNIFDLYVDASKRKEMLTLLKKDGFVSNFEVQFYTKSKEIRYCLLNTRLHNGKIIGMLLDITPLKNNQTELSKLSLAIQQSPVSIIITNKNSVIEYANPKVFETTGYSYDELIGQNPRILNSGNKPALEYKQLYDTLLSGKEWFGEFENKKKNGELFWERASISPVFNFNNEITHFIALKEDITNEREILKELTISKEKAEESDRLKSAFLANMSHEIRTPMNGILGFSELLKTPNLSAEKQQKYIEIIEKSGARMLTTINDIIDISRIESNLVTIYNKEVNITNQINEIYSFFKPEALKKDLRLHKSLALNSNELIINSDPDKIYAIIQNLVKNAIKFTKKGSVEVGCFIQNNSLNIYVKDTGIGISKNRQPYVFDRFVQADIEDKEVFEGSGLGLTISKSYAKMLGGDIILESTEGIGSTFTFSLPFEKTTNSISESSTIKIPENTNNHLNNLNILIVDDENLVQLYLQEILFKRAANLFVASNGVEAIQLLTNHPEINLILLDMQMPTLNGFETAKEIRKTNKEVIIIAQTAFVQTGDKEKTLAAGCNDYISKPINQLELFEKIDKNMVLQNKFI